MSAEDYPHELEAINADLVHSQEHDCFEETESLLIVRDWLLAKLGGIGILGT